MSVIEDIFEEELEISELQAENPDCDVIRSEGVIHIVAKINLKRQRNAQPAEDYSKE